LGVSGVAETRGRTQIRILLTVAGVGVLTLLAMVFVFRQEASANDDPSCAPTAGYIPQFCVNVPVGTSVGRETTVPLSTVLTLRTRVGLESRIPASEAIRLASSLDSETFGSTAAPVAYTLTAGTATLDGRATIDTVPTTPEAAQAVPQDRSLEREVATEAPTMVIDQAVLRAYARNAAIANGIDPNIFERQINAESAFNPYAVSKAGAVGIAQILPSWHPNVDPTDPFASLDYAARLMRGYINHFGSWRLALIAYNAGPGRLMPGNPNAALGFVRRWRDQALRGEDPRLLAGRLLVPVLRTAPSSSCLARKRGEPGVTGCRGSVT
jgi:hypothetical protein